MTKFFVLLMPAWFACGACPCGEFPSALLMPGRLICVFECFVIVISQCGSPRWRNFILIIYAYVVCLCGGYLSYTGAHLERATSIQLL